MHVRDKDALDLTDPERFAPHELMKRRLARIYDPSTTLHVSFCVRGSNNGAHVAVELETGARDVARKARDASGSAQENH